MCSLWGYCLSCVPCRLRCEQVMRWMCLFSLSHRSLLRLIFRFRKGGLRSRGCGDQAEVADLFEDPRLIGLLIICATLWCLFWTVHQLVRPGFFRYCRCSLLVAVLEQIHWGCWPERIVIKVEDAVTTFSHGHRCLNHPIPIIVPLCASLRLPRCWSLSLVLTV